MSEVVGRDTHDCLRDELPEFMGYGARRAPQHDAGDIVQCSCGEYWLCLDGGFARYKRLSRRKALRLISRKENDAASA